MPQKHNLGINFFKSLELIFKSWVVEAEWICKKTRLEAVDAGQRRHDSLDFGAKREEGEDGADG